MSAPHARKVLLQTSRAAPCRQTEAGRWVRKKKKEPFLTVGGRGVVLITDAPRKLFRSKEFAL